MVESEALPGWEEPAMLVDHNPLFQKIVQDFGVVLHIFVARLSMMLKEEIKLLLGVTELFLCFYTFHFHPRKHPQFETSVITTWKTKRVVSKNKQLISQSGCKTM